MLKYPGSQPAGVLRDQEIAIEIRLSLLVGGL